MSPGRLAEDNSFTIRNSSIPSLNAEDFGRVKFHSEMEFTIAIEKTKKMKKDVDIHSQ